MKKFNFVMLYLLFFISANAQVWNPVISGTNRNLHDVCLVGNQTVYAISSAFYGDKGWGMDILLRSFDNGTSWDSMYMDGIGMDIFFLNDSVGFLSGGMPSCGIAPTVMKTTDRGVTWNGWAGQGSWNTPWDVGMGYSAAYFWDADNGYIFGGNWGAKQYSTTDNGSTWTDIYTFKSRDAYPDIFFLDESEGYLVSDSIDTQYDSLGNIISQVTFGFIYKTTNGGNNWAMQSFPGYKLTDVSFPSQSTGYVTGGTTLFKTIDAGTNWGLIPLPFESVKIAFMNENRGYCIDTDGDIYKTINGGNSWTLDYTGDFLALEVNKGRGFAVGTNGSIVRLDAGTSPISGKDNLSPFQVFPNPSSGNLQIVAPDYSAFKVAVLNAAGQTVLSSENSGNLILNLDALVPEIYFIYIKDSQGNLLQVEKIVRE